MRGEIEGGNGSRDRVGVQIDRGGLEVEIEVGVEIEGGSGGKDGRGGGGDERGKWRGK